MTRTGSLHLALCLFSVAISLSERLSPTHFSSGIILRISEWLLCWFARGKLDPSSRGDLLLFFGCVAWRFRHQVLFQLRALSNLERSVVIAGAALVLSVYGAWTYSWTTPKREPREPIEHLFNCPLIFRSRTTHSRLFPKKHSFSYSYLVVAIPVGFQGVCGDLLSVDVKEGRRWLHVQASDHLERSKSHSNLRSKLSSYLQSQGVGDNEWSYAYLVTAPRVLGYSFNPASFWYIYNDKNVLNKMIIEVNNTFDERRLYLLDAAAQSSKDDRFDDPASADADEKAWFKDTWTKDFHVSPFNSRKGSYTLAAEDPFGGARTLPGPINTTIVLKSSKEHGKIVARLFSEGPPINPTDLPLLGAARFFASWWWVGFVTFPRILKEAWKLFFTRGLHVWFRPEVQATSIGRTATATEIALEEYFRKYITSTVEQHPDPIRLTYHPHQGDAIKIFSKPDPARLKDCQGLEIKVLTPAFYSRFIHYSHTSEAFDRECFFTDEKNCTVWTSSPEMLATLFPQKAPMWLRSSSPSSVMTKLRWKIHAHLRCPPEAPAYTSHSQDDTTTVKDIRPATLSELDRYVSSYCHVDAALYRRLCGTHFLATRFAFGFAGFVAAADLLLRMLSFWCLTTPVLLRNDGEAANWWLASVPAIGEVACLFSLHLLSWIKGL